MSASVAETSTPTASAAASSSGTRKSSHSCTKWQRWLTLDATVVATVVADVGGSKARVSIDGSMADMATTGAA